MPARSYIANLSELSAAGNAFVSVTLVDAVGSTPQDSGAKMLVDATGLRHGTVGGGRVEQQAILHAQAMLAGGGQTQLVEWNLQRDVGMTCGGVVKLFFEPYNVRPWRVALFGAGHVAQALVPVLLQMDCVIECLDSRQDWLNRMPDATQLTRTCEPDLASRLPSLAAEDFVLCITMGHRTDRPILEAILKRDEPPPVYLGVIGSRAKRKVLVRELIAAGVQPDRAEAFRCPIGLPLGSNQPGEIAVSVAAEMIQVRDALRGPRHTAGPSPPA